jgi:hypothetical protein
LLVSDALAERDIKGLGLDQPLRLHWLAAGHASYLDYHRLIYAETAGRVG